MKTKTLQLLPLSLLLSVFSFAQSPDWVWAKSAGGSANEIANSVATDNSGNVYVAGSFRSSTVIFGSTTLTNAGNDDIFIVKYDASGNVLWAKSTGGDGSEEYASICTDTSGNVYMTGNFTSSFISFDSITLTVTTHPIKKILTIGC